MSASLLPRPANADGAASTRNIILGAAAATAVILSTTHQRRPSGGTIVGHTDDGGLIYADGRVVYEGGDVLYTSNGDGAVCAWVGSYNPCSPHVVVFYPRYYRGHDHGHHYGWHKKHDRDDRGHEDRDEHR
jgi:hypothetical protein